MRQIDPRQLTGDGAALLTVESVEDLAPMMAADFKDDHALSAGGLYVGISPEGRVVLCSGPAWMSGGLWRAAVDEAATASGGPLTRERLSLVLIK